LEQAGPRTPGFVPGGGQELPARVPFPWDQTEMGGLFPSGAMLDPIWKVRNWEVRGTRGALHVRVSGLEHLGPGTLPEAWTE